MLVHPAGGGPPTSALRFLAREVAARRVAQGTRWRRPAAGRQALLVLAHLRRGHTYAQLAAGFGGGTTTAHHYIAEAVVILAALAPPLAEAVRTASGKAFVILDRTLPPIDRTAAELVDYERELLAPLIPRVATRRPCLKDRQPSNGMVHKIRPDSAMRNAAAGPAAAGPSDGGGNTAH